VPCEFCVFGARACGYVHLLLRGHATIGLASPSSICASVCVSAFESVSVVVSVVMSICARACDYVLL
jgi:uncharacterized protein YsxB (DUF464 family)